MTKTGNIRTAAVVAIRAPAVHGVSSNLWKISLAEPKIENITSALSLQLRSGHVWQVYEVLDDTRRARWPFRDLLCRVSTKISYVREVQHDYAIMM